MSHADATPSPRALARVYTDPDRARRAIQALQTAGVPAQAISVLRRSTHAADDLAWLTGTSDDLEDATTRRHRVSDLLDWLGRLESAAVPGFGAVLGTGNLWQDIAPAAERRGAITGALVGLGISVDEAARLEQAVLQGGLLLVIHGPSLTASPDRLRSILETD